MASIEGSRIWARRHHVRFPFRNRWLIVKLRARTWTWRTVTWRQVWQDVIYLVRG